MSIELNHTIVHARDPLASATFLSEMLGRSAPVRFGPFWDVQLDNHATLAYIEADEHLTIEHYAFLVSEKAFDQIFERIRARGLPFWADPAHQQPGRINHHDGGRGVYWNDPNGHYLEIITRPYGSGANPASDPAAGASRDPGALTGHCLCGAVTVAVTGAHDPRVGACHCRMCQRWSGGLFLCFRAEASAVTVTGEVARYRSSSFAERAFCPRCGSHLWFNDVDDSGQPRSYELMPGLFDAARSWPLRSEIYVDRALASVHLVGDHRRKSRAEYEADNAHVEGDLDHAA